MPFFPAIRRRTRPPRYDPRMTTSNPAPKIYIIGGGFGGLSAAKPLARAQADVTIIDSHNYHLFQPLLYQVATAALSPADITTPIRTILRGQRNAQHALATITGVDVQNRHVNVKGGHVQYDYLILAA